MSKRGKALGGKYKGIYKKRLKDGTVRYTVLIKYLKTDGKPGYRTQTAGTLSEAVKIRQQGRAKRALGQLKQDKAAPATVGTMVQTMMAIKANHVQPHNAKARLREIERFFGKDTLIRDIDEANLQRFRGYLETRINPRTGKADLAAATKNHLLKELRHLLNTSKEKGYLGHVPPIKMYRDFGCREYNVDMGSFWRLFEALAPAPKPFRAMLLMALITGQRRGDLLCMRKKQIHRGLIRFRSTKTSRELVVKCPEILAKELKKLPKCNSAFLFPSPVDPAKPRSNFYKELQLASKKAGLKPITLHMIRHLCADELMRLTGNAFYVQRYIGWSSAKMVERYTHVETWSESIVEAFEQRIVNKRNEKKGQHSARVNATKGCTQVVPRKTNGSPRNATAAQNACAPSDSVRQSLQSKMVIPHAITDLRRRYVAVCNCRTATARLAGQIAVIVMVLYFLSFQALQMENVRPSLLL